MPAGDQEPFEDLYIGLSQTLLARDEREADAGPDNYVREITGTVWLLRGEPETRTRLSG